MKSNEYNNDFFSYNGCINRKNYAINMLILLALYIATTLVNFKSFTQFTDFKFLQDVLLFLVDFFKFVVMISALSVIYRRIADIAKKHSERFFENAKKLFAIFFVFPVLYIYCLQYLLDIIPILTTILGTLTVFVLMPLGLIFIVVLSFIKGE